MITWFLIGVVTAFPLWFSLGWITRRDEHRQLARRRPLRCACGCPGHRPPRITAAAQRVAHPAVLGDHPADPGDRAPVGDPAGDRPPDPAAEVGDLAARTRALIAATPGRPPGRRVLARELGVTEHQARTLLGLVSSNGTSPTDGGRPR